MNHELENPTPQDEAWLEAKLQQLASHAPAAPTAQQVLAQVDQRQARRYGWGVAMAAGLAMAMTLIPLWLTSRAQQSPSAVPVASHQADPAQPAHSTVTPGTTPDITTDMATADALASAEALLPEARLLPADVQDQLFKHLQQLGVADELPLALVESHPGLTLPAASLPLPATVYLSLDDDAVRESLRQMFHTDTVGLRMATFQ